MTLKRIFIVLPLLLTLLFFINVFCLNANTTTLHIKVIDREGLPLEGARIHLFQRGYYVASRVSDGNGEAIFKDVVMNVSTRIVVYYEGIRVADYKVFLKQNSLIITCNVHKVKVVVLNPYEEPVANVTVVFEWQAFGTYCKSTITDANGIAELKIPSTTVNIIVLKKYGSTTIQLLKHRENITSSKTLTFHVNLFNLNVSVIDNRGFIVNGAFIYVKSLNYSFIMASTLRDKNVLFNFLPEGCYEISAFYGSHSNTTTITLSKHRSVVVKLSNLKFSSYSLIISVSWSDGNPVTNAHVIIHRNGVIIDQMETDEHGIAVTSVIEGNYTIEISHPDSKDKKVITLYVNKDAKCQVTLDYKWPLYKLTIIAKSGGLTIPHAKVLIYRNGTLIVQGETDNDGVAAFTLREGVYEVKVEHEDLGSTSTEVNLKGDMTVEVALPETPISTLYSYMPMIIISSLIIVAIVTTIACIKLRKSIEAP